MSYPVISGAKTVASAISIKRLLKVAGITPSTVHLVLLKRFDLTPSVLAGGAVLNPAGSFTNSLVPVVEINNGTTEYVRPPMGAGGPYSEVIASGSGTPLDVYVYQGRRLTVSVALAQSGNSTTIPTGKPVQFSAYVRGAGLSYTWSFGHGQTADGATVVHRFKQPANPTTVYVTVVGADGSAGVASRPVIVQSAARNPA
ncbi:MAG: PKD domain-containing protein, partial [Actinomycetota bacterium]|nr:PKD domain-containing protein [Actinomycetota bacterium]